MRVETSVNDRFYRKGLVLGFTMAEIMVLVIFSILLVLAAIMLRKDEQLSKITSQDPALVSKVIDTLHAHISDKLEISDQIKELELALAKAEQTSALESRILELQRQLDNLKQIQKIVETQGAEEAKRQAISDMSVGRELRERAVSQTPPVDLSDLDRLLSDASDNQRKVKELSAENDTLKGQLINLTERLGGKGTEYPPCWVSANGKPEYIFDMALTTDGIIVRDRKLPHRAPEQSNLPLDGIVFDTVVGVSRFTSMTTPLLNWSKERNCRFFVRIYDQTGASEKERYKSLERTLQQSFYSYEVLNERF